MSNPARSSGENWTDEEDEQLRALVAQLAAQFPTRSVAAVLSRIDYCRPRNGWTWPALSKEEPLGPRS